MPRFEFKTAHSDVDSTVQLFVDGRYHHQLSYSPRLEGAMIEQFEQQAEAYLTYHYHAKNSFKAEAATC